MRAYDWSIIVCASVHQPHHVLKKSRKGFSQIRLTFETDANKNDIIFKFSNVKQNFDTANQRFSELAAAQEFFSDFISDLK